MSASKQTILSVEHLKKYFQTASGQLHAVDDVNFTLAKGETLGVVGESGCGKSTLGRTILRLHEPTDGKVIFDGKDVTACSKQEMKKLREDMQIIFQDPFASINPRMTVSQTIAEPLLIQGKYKPGDKEALNRHVRQVMDRVGLAQRLVNAYPHELDGGRRQRIGIGRALALEPKFIVCDEPVSALDVSIQAQILNLMQDIQPDHRHVSGAGRGDLRCKAALPCASTSLHKGAAVRHSDSGSAGQNEQDPAQGRAFVPNQPQARLSVCKALPVCHTGVHCGRHPAVRDRARSQRSLHQGRAIQGCNGVNAKKRMQI